MKTLASFAFQLTLLLTFCCIQITSVHAQFGNQIVGWVKPDPNYYYKMKSVPMGNYWIRVAGNGRVNGQNIDVYPDQDLDSQLFRFKSVGGGYYEIVSKLNDNMVLDVQGGKTDNGTNIQLYRRNRTSSQRFKIGRDRLGNVFFITKLKSNKTLAAKKTGGMRISTNVYLTSLNYALEQKFKLKKTRYLTSEGLKPVKENLSASQSWVLKPLYDTKWNIIDPSGGSWILTRKDQRTFWRFERVPNSSYYRIKSSDSICLSASAGRVKEMGCSTSITQKFKVDTYEYKGDLYVAIESVSKRAHFWDVPGVARKTNAAKIDSEWLQLKIGRNRLSNTQVFKLDGPYPVY